MAKKKSETEAEVNENLDYVSRLEKEIKKEFGDSVWRNPKDLIDKPNQIISFSPSVDIALNGGIPEGCVWILSGKPKVGKSTSVLSIASNSQTLDKHIYYLDIESRLKKINLDIEGLDLNKFTHLKGSPEDQMTAEKWLTVAEKIIRTHPGSMVIVDSVSALCAESEYIQPITGMSRSAGPKLLSSFFKKVSNSVNSNKIMLFAIQHLIANTSGYGEAFMEDGGFKIQYAMDGKMRAKGMKPWIVGSGDNQKQIGQIIEWNIITSALGGLPNTKVQSYIRYGVGIDRLKEWIEMGLNFGLISKNGTWYSIGELKFQGEENLYQGIKEDKELQNKLISDVKFMLT